MKLIKIYLTLLVYLLFLAGCDNEGCISFDTCINKGDLYIKKDEPEKAITYYKKAIKINPNDAKIHFTLGMLYHNLWKRSYEEAYKKYSLDTFKDVKRSMNLIEDLKKYGLKNEYKDMALHEYQETLNITPDNWPAREYLATDYLNNKKYLAAIDQYKTLIKYNPTSSISYWHIADAYLHTGDYDQAIKNINSAYNIEKKIEYYYFRLGQVYYKMNQTEKAFIMLTNLKKMNSTYYNDLLSYKYSTEK